MSDKRTSLFQRRENSQSQLFVKRFWSWHCCKRKIFRLGICVSFPYDVLVSRGQNCFGARIIKNERISLLKNCLKMKAKLMLKIILDIHWSPSRVISELWAFSIYFLVATG